jgi:hypothetical protein
MSRRKHSGVAARATPQMGSEATIRYLKARLAVMEEELSEVHLQREWNFEMKK